MTSHTDAATPKVCEVCGRPDCNTPWRPHNGRSYLVSGPEGVRLEVHEDPVAGPERPEPRRGRRARRPVEDTAKRPAENRAHEPGEDR
jgi:hypothetical protein